MRRFQTLPFPLNGLTTRCLIWSTNIASFAALTSEAIRKMRTIKCIWYMVQIVNLHHQMLTFYFHIFKGIWQIWTIKCRSKPVQMVPHSPWEEVNPLSLEPSTNPQLWLWLKCKLQIKENRNTKKAKWTNEFTDLYKYYLQFGQIHLEKKLTLSLPNLPQIPSFDIDLNANCGYKKE